MVIFIIIGSKDRPLSKLFGYRLQPSEFDTLQREEFFFFLQYLE
jgi:ABC-type enterochelin transport system permease subunit